MATFAKREKGLVAFPKRRTLAFAVFSPRWQEEITRIQLTDPEAAIDTHPALVPVRAMERPGKTQGSAVKCHLMPEAAAARLAMEKANSRFISDAIYVILSAFPGGLRDRRDHGRSPPQSAA